MIMNENLDLTKILEGCEGVKLYSPLCGECTLCEIDDSPVQPIVIEHSSGDVHLGANGRLFYEGEVVLFPSKDQRDWSKFEKPSKFPKTCAEAHQMLSTEEGVDLSDDMRKLISLIEARNAYWKVDGNWKPDWKASEAKYILFNYRGVIDYSSREFNPCILAFRTSDIRNEFYRNFKDLIEACKDYI